MALHLEPGVDDSSIGFNSSGNIITKSAGITNNSVICRYIANNKLSNHTITINGSEVSIGWEFNTSRHRYTYTSGRINLDGTTFRASVDDSSADLLVVVIYQLKHLVSLMVCYMVVAANNKPSNHIITINGSEVSLGGSLIPPDTDTTYTSDRY